LKSFPKDEELFKKALDITKKEEAMKNFLLYFYSRISLHKVWQRIIILGMWNGPLKILPFAG
jgi:hypothetical protein